MDNYLVPFNYKQDAVTLKANEALWPFVEGKFQLRFTRAQVGRIFGAKNGQKYMNKLCHRHPHLSKIGIPMEVVSYQEDTFHGERYPTSKNTDDGFHCGTHHTPKTRGRRNTYTVLTYDVDEMYYFAIESELKKARMFLRIYPQLKEQIAIHGIKPPKIEDIEPEILGFFGLPFKERGAYQKKVSIKYGWSRAKFYRKREKAAAILGIPPEQTKCTGQPRKTRSDKGASKSTPTLH